MFGRGRKDKRVKVRSEDFISPSEPLAGPGPTYVAPGYDDTGPITPAGDGWGPVIGRSQPTHQQVIDAGLWGDPKTPADNPDGGYSEGRWPRGRERLVRGSVEHLDGDGWPTPTEAPSTPNGGRIPPPAVRWTGQSHAELDSFVVTETAQSVPHGLTGDHFSMADHRREYDILGMQPVRSSRNTYRVEPTPWDSDVVDRPDAERIVRATQVDPDDDVDAVQNAYGGASRSSYRL